MNEITILAGTNKQNEKENFTSFTLRKGEITTVIGNTGCGKSRFLQDIVQFVNKDSLTKRSILIDGKPVPIDLRNKFSTNYVSHLSQNMRFVLDTNVLDFLNMHCLCRNKKVDLNQVLDCANTITLEPITFEQNLTALSGGQTRALMIADLAYISNNPIILIDEIENAGIDYQAALKILLQQDKFILIITHDPTTALIADHRILIENGGVVKIIHRNKQEEALLQSLSSMTQYLNECQIRLKKGETLNENCPFILE